MKIAVKIIFFIMAATTLENRQNHFFIPFLLSLAGRQSAAHMPLSAAAYKTAALCLPAAVCMSAGNTNVSCMTGMILVEFALTRFTADGCIFFDICCMTGLTATSFRCKTSTTGFGRSFCLCSFHLNIRSSAAVVCIIRTVYHITIQFCHLTYLLVLNHRCHISMYQTTWSYSVPVLLFKKARYQFF